MAATKQSSSELLKTIGWVFTFALLFVVANQLLLAVV